MLALFIAFYPESWGADVKLVKQAQNYTISPQKCNPERKKKETVRPQ